MGKRIINKYHKLPIPFKATIWMTLCQFLQKGLSILTTPFFTRILSTEEYGRMSVFFSWESMVSLLITLSSAKAINNLCVRYEDKKEVLSCIIGLNISLSAFFTLLIGVLFGTVIRFTGLSKLLIICMIIHCFFQSNILCWIGIKQYDYEYRIVVYEILAYSVVSTIGGLMTVVFITQTAEARIIPQVIASVILGLLIILSTFRNNKKFHNQEIWKYTICFSVPLLPHYFSEIILLNSDRIMIDRMCGSTDVAIYSIAYSVGSLITMMTGAINSAFMPYQYHKITDKEYKVLAKNTNYIIGFIAFCLCGVMLFGREVVLIFGGTKYLKSVSLIIPISLGVFFNYVFQLFARVQEYFEQKYTIVIASVSCALLNIILNFVFINLYGYKAAAYTTFACYFTFCFLHYLFYKKACKKYVGQEIYDVKGLALISVALIALSLVISIVSRLYFVKYIALLITFIIVIWKCKRIIEFAKTIGVKK